MEAKHGGGVALKFQKEVNWASLLGCHNGCTMNMTELQPANVRHIATTNQKKVIGTLIVMDRPQIAFASAANGAHQVRGS